jgi:hypothetical protein
MWIDEFECLGEGEGLGLARGECRHRTDF